MTAHKPVADGPAILDNRRATVRIMGYEIVRGLASLARLNGGDMIQLIVFTGIWTSNTQHLMGERLSYVALHDIPPDSQRRPIAQDALCDVVAMPGDIVARYVDRLIEQGMVERLPGGLVVPSAVFNRQDMLDGSNELNTRVVSMVVALRGAGFRFGDD